MIVFFVLNFVKLNRKFFICCKDDGKSFSSFFITSSWFPVVVLLIYMTAVVVILLNILIAQMSSTYIKAKKTAKLQYDADRMLIITRLEHSRFRRFVSFFFHVFSLGTG